MIKRGCGNRVSFRLVILTLCLLYVLFVFVMLRDMELSTENGSEVSRTRENEFIENTNKRQLENIIYQLENNLNFRKMLYDRIDRRSKDTSEQLVKRRADYIESQNNQFRKEIQRLINKAVNKIQKNSKNLRILNQALSEKNLSIDNIDMTEKNSFVTEEMANTHERVWNKMYDGEIKAYFEKESVAYKKYFGRVLDIENDREKLMALFPGPDEKNDRISEQLLTQIKVSEDKLIYMEMLPEIYETQKKFRRDNCNVKQCTFTDDKSRLSEADLIYSEGKMNPDFFQMRKRKKQVLAVFQLEPAQYFKNISMQSINWTASYRRDSVVSAPYERFTPYINTRELPKVPKRNYARGKNKMIAWFVSNCLSVNGRLEYAEELQKHVDLDIYGRCGDLTCGRMSRKCDEKLKKDYKFYLAFENCNCKDYVTEKLFRNSFQNDVVPIVMGAHPEDYKSIAPPNSYIHVDDFESPKHLAQYLHFLDQNDEYYNQYFLWKETGRFINTKFLCRLCTMVHLAPHFPMWYSDAKKWWFDRDVCSLRYIGDKYSTWRGFTRNARYPGYVKYGYNRTS